MELDLNSKAYKKAMLITGGDIKVAEDFKFPYRLSRSTAGPGAGRPSIVLSFEGTRVKKSISRERGDFELIEINGEYELLKEGGTFVERVELQPVVFHAPGQAFINLGQSCIYDCKFCNSSHLGKDYAKDLSPEKVIEMVLGVSNRSDLKAVALTSAVVGSPHKTAMKLAYVISELREKLGPEIPIGVEPYIDDVEDIYRLRVAGANEIKLNIESFDRDIFHKVCEELDYDHIIKSIKYAVSVFGRERVASNIIYGMGETDENVIEGVEALARIGCLANLRPLQVDENNRSRLVEALGQIQPITPERMVRLAYEQKEVFVLYDISPLNMKTMCGACQCCDLVPFVDV